MSNPINGRGPNGRALRRDGTERKERRTLSTAERMAQIADAQIRAHASIGRDIFASVPGLAGFVSGVGTFKKWIRDARAYATEGDRAKRREYFQRQIDLIDAKGERAESFLPDASKAVATISGLYQNIGKAVEAFIRENGREPNDVEANQIVSGMLSDDVRKVVENANNPENDVFYGLRRDDVTEDSAEDSDTL